MVVPGAMQITGEEKRVMSFSYRGISVRSRTELEYQENVFLKRLTNFLAGS